MTGRAAWLGRPVLVLALAAYAIPAVAAMGTEWGYWLIVGWVGWPVVGAVVGIGLIALRKMGREVPMAFGPYLAMAGWIVFIWGDPFSSTVFGMR